MCGTIGAEGTEKEGLLIVGTTPRLRQLKEGPWGTKINLDEDGFLKCNTVRGGRK